MLETAPVSTFELVTLWRPVLTCFAIYQWTATFTKNHNFAVFDVLCRCKKCRLKQNEIPLLRRHQKQQNCDFCKRCCSLIDRKTRQNRSPKSDQFESAHRSNFEHFRVKRIDVSNFVTLKIKNPCFDNRTLCKKSMVLKRFEKFCSDFCIFEVVQVGAVVLWKLLIWSKESVRGDQTTGRQSHYILESVKIVYVLRGTATFWYRFGPLLGPPSFGEQKRFEFRKK